METRINWEKRTTLIECPAESMNSSIGNVGCTFNSNSGVFLQMACFCQQQMRRFETISNKIRCHIEELTDAFWKTIVSRCTSIAASTDNIRSTKTLSTIFLAWEARTSLRVTITRQSCHIEFGSEWKHFCTAVVSYICWTANSLQFNPVGFTYSNVRKGSRALPWRN